MTDAWASTAVSPAPGHPGRYRAEISDVWTVALVPQGGVVAAVAARAMLAELTGADEPDSTGAAHQLRSMHSVFAAPVPAGPVEVDVQVLRRGRSMSQVQATVRSPGASAGLTALAVFGGERPGFAFTDLVPPVVPPPEDCPSFRDPPPPEVEWPDFEPRPFWERVLEGRAALGLPPWDRAPRTSAEVAQWCRFEHPPVGDDGRMDLLSLLVLADLMPGAVGQRVGMTGWDWFGPSVDLTVHLFAAPRPGWLLGHNRARLAADGYASVDLALWDMGGVDGPELVAYATQQMFFAFSGEVPPPEHRRV